MTHAIAAIDIGTNSTKMTVVHIDEDGGLTTLLERSEVTRLGEGVGRSGVLKEDAVGRTLGAIVRFADEARLAGAGAVLGAGTSALRDASNANLLLDAAREQAGLDIEIIAGDREAQLAFAAVRHDTSLRMTDASVLVFDIGGGSTELIAGAGGLKNRVSLDIGAVRLTERFVTSDPPSAEETDRIEQCARDAIQDAFGALTPHSLEGRGVGGEGWIPEGITNVVGIGGTAINIAAIAAGDPDREVHGATVTRADVAAIYDRLRRCTLAERCEIPGLEAARADVIVAGAAILLQLMIYLNARGYTVSLRGMRYGMILQYLVDKGLLPDNKKPAPAKPAPPLDDDASAVRH